MVELIFFPFFNSQNTLSSIFSHLKCLSEHYFSHSNTFFIINIINVKLFIFSSPYSVSGTVLHFNFNAHFIYPNKDLSILYNKINITSSKQKMTLPVKFLEKGTMSDYLIIIVKVFESVFELSNTNVKLKILNNRYNLQVTGFIVSGDVYDNSMFIISR